MTAELRRIVREGVRRGKLKERKRPKGQSLSRLAFGIDRLALSQTIFRLRWGNAALSPARLQIQRFGQSGERLIGFGFFVQGGGQNLFGILVSQQAGIITNRAITSDFVML